MTLLGSRRKSQRPSHLALRENLASEAKKMEAEGYLTIHAAAEVSGRGLATIYRWCRGEKPVLETKTTGVKGTRHRLWVSEASLRDVTGISERNPKPVHRS